MIIFRYLAKEVFITLASLTTILMLIFMSNQFMRYLSRAASGKIPAVFIMKLMMLELPNLMGLLLPLGFYVALLLAYGRLYAESEMTVLQACGYGPNQLLKHSFIMASVVAGAVMIIMLWVSPMIAVERAKLLRTTGIQTLIKTIVPGRFREIPGGRQVFYVEKMNPAHTEAKHVFLAKLVEKNNRQQWDVIWADKAYAETEESTGEDYIILQDGKAYEGQPGKADYQVAEFSDYRARLPHPVSAVSEDIRTAATKTLWPLNNPDRQKAAELQWRLSIPIMVFVLTLVAVPLSRVSPRSGKYAKLLPAVVLFIIYANFMFVARDWLIAGKLPIWLGMGWLHFAVAAFGLFLIWRNGKKLS
ncbi:LPS export ABC transporter permease LptF [Legionella londiniensis]|uniref:Lipopolysaccharide export system permease protein LptF n=1 Tax=Legionella londiniensis TaxID=45068 RepID=A0A0W0VR52_9GAMM|nr:LPS export ABC transporter permease LptF [Legionella londiniensis]KTD22590.1 hypothetical protein Llon_0464 [Legionella londiniensis]STX92521.1 permease [Legionella londiniensis]